MKTRESIELILFKAYAELKAESSRFYAGFLWWVLEPVIYMAAFYVIFGIIFDRKGEISVPFLLCGLVMWKYFAGTIASAGNSILSHISLIRQVYVHKYIFPATVLVTNTVHFFFILLILLIFLMLCGIQPHITWIALLPVLLNQILFTAGCSCLASAVIPLVPDVHLLVEKALLLGLFVSGVFFDVSKVPPPLKLLFMLNPVALNINLFRKVLIHHQWPDVSLLLGVGLFSLLLLILSRRLILRWDRLYPKIIV